jgi:hypothetical protein
MFLLGSVNQRIMINEDDFNDDLLVKNLLGIASRQFIVNPFLG